MKLDLDNPESLYKLDSMGMFKSVWNLPAQCREAGLIGAELSLPKRKSWSQVIIAGMGGSAIGGELLRALAQERLDIPVCVSRDYQLPCCADYATLVFVVSYSGNTEEALSAYADAQAKGAFTVVFTGGGALRQKAIADGTALVSLPKEAAPRAAIALLFIPMLRVLEKLGLLPDLQSDIEKAAAHLEGLRAYYGPTCPLTENPAKQIAQALDGRIPLIWGAAGKTEAVAQRWKTQFNENAKALAFWNVFPELTHNEIMSLDSTESYLSLSGIIILRDRGESELVARRIEAAKTLIPENTFVREVQSSGDNVLSRLYSLIYLGDYSSMYLAALKGLDPGPVPKIERLKEKLMQKY